MQRKPKFQRPDFETTIFLNDMPIEKGVMFGAQKVMSLVGEMMFGTTSGKNTIMQHRPSLLEFTTHCQSCHKTIYHSDCDECGRGICFQCDQIFSAEVLNIKDETPDPGCQHCLGTTVYNKLCEKHKTLIFEMRNKLFRTIPESLYTKYGTYQPTLQQVLDKNFVEAGEKICIGCCRCICKNKSRENVYDLHGVKDLVIVDWSDFDGKRLCLGCFNERKKPIVLECD